MWLANRGRWRRTRKARSPRSEPTGAPSPRAPPRLHHGPLDSRRRPGLRRRPRRRRGVRGAGGEHRLARPLCPPLRPDRRLRPTRRRAVRRGRGLAPKGGPARARPAAQPDGARGEREPMARRRCRGCARGRGPAPRPSSSTRIPLSRRPKPSLCPIATEASGRRLQRACAAPARPSDGRARYSGSSSPEPPNSCGRSLNLGSPSLIETILLP